MIYYIFRYCYWLYVCELKYTRTVKPLITVITYRYTIGKYRFDGSPLIFTFNNIYASL